MLLPARKPLSIHPCRAPCLILILTADAARAVQNQGLARTPRLLVLLPKEGLGHSHSEVWSEQIPAPAWFAVWVCCCPG